MIVHMLDDRTLALLIQSLAAARGWKVSTASRVVSGSWDTVARIKGGGSLTQRRAIKIMANINRLWPSDLPWPEGIERPEVKREEAA
jgi:hypothetical protein